MRPKKEPHEQTTIFDGMTQHEVAESLGITRNAVQQIEKRAYKKFRRELAKRLKHISDLL